MSVYLLDKSKSRWKWKSEVERGMPAVLPFMKLPTTFAQTPAQVGIGDWNQGLLNRALNQLHHHLVPALLPPFYYMLTVYISMYSICIGGSHA